MRRPKLLYVHEYTDCRGKPRRYFRRPGYPRVLLPGLPGSEEFREAYELAMSGEKKPVGVDRSGPGTIGAAVASYLQSVPYEALAKETRRTRKSMMEALRKEHGHRPLAGMSQASVQRMINKKAATPDGARNFLNALKGLIRHCIAVRLLTKDPTIGVTRPPIKTGGFYTWSEADIKKFEDRHPVGTRARLALALLLYTAQRRGDVIRMGPQHVQNGHIRVKQGKTSTELMIPLHPELIRVLKGTPTKHLTFLTTANGKQFEPAGFGNWFRDVCNDAGLSVGISAHGLRKAACRRLADAGCSAKQIGAISGHRSLRELEKYVEAADQQRMAGDAIRSVVAAFPVAKNGTPSG